MGTTITFQRPDGKIASGYLAKPANPSDAPGIVVIQEWWGVNDQIRGVADRLAQAGYRALVPDLYRGQLTVEAEEAHHLMTGLNFGDAASQDIRGAVLHLKQGSGNVSPKVGITGFCMGGALTLLGLCATPEADAASPGTAARRWNTSTRRRSRFRCSATGPRRTSSSRSPPSMRWKPSCVRPARTSSSIATWRTTPSPTKPPSGQGGLQRRSSIRCGPSEPGIGRLGSWGSGWGEWWAPDLRCYRSRR